MKILTTVMDFARTGEESVELHEKLNIGILGLGGLSVAIPHMVSVQVDTYRVLISLVLSKCFFRVRIQSLQRL